MTTKKPTKASAPAAIKTPVKKSAAKRKSVAHDVLEVTGEVHRVIINLTPEQRVELEALTGKKIEKLQITVEDLADLSNVILN